MTPSVARTSELDAAAAFVTVAARAALDAVAVSLVAVAADVDPSSQVAAVKRRVPAAMDAPRRQANVPELDVQLAARTDVPERDVPERDVRVVVAADRLNQVAVAKRPGLAAVVAPLALAAVTMAAPVVAPEMAAAVAAAAGDVLESLLEFAACWLADVVAAVQRSAAVMVAQADVRAATPVAAAKTPVLGVPVPDVLALVARVVAAADALATVLCQLTPVLLRLEFPYRLLLGR